MAFKFFMVTAVVSRQSKPFTGLRDMINGWQNNENSACVVAPQEGRA